jgi:hypothetical protein
MPIDDAIGEVVGEAVGFVVRQAGGLVVDLTVSHIFSRHTARFFHGVGRRAIAVATLGGVRIPSSLRMVPAGMKARPRRADWLALWVGLLFWIALFVAIGVTASRLL